LEAALSSFNFSTFDKESAASAKRPELTIQSRGDLVLNGPAYRLLGEPTGVALLYDEEQSVVGLRALPPGDPGAHPVRATTNGTMFRVSGVAFLKYYDIPFGTSVKREVWMADDVLVVDLKDPGRDVAPTRRRERLEDLAKRLVDEMEKARQRKRTKAA